MGPIRPKFLVVFSTPNMSLPYEFQPPSSILNFRIFLDLNFLKGIIFFIFDLILRHYGTYIFEN